MGLQKNMNQTHGYCLIGEPGTAATSDQGNNITLLISIVEQGLGLGLAREGGIYQQRDGS